MPELIETPVTLGSFAEIVPAYRGLFLVVIGDDGEEGRLQLGEALSVIESGDLPGLGSLLASPFVNLAIVSNVLDLGAAATTSVNVTNASGTITSLGTSAPEGAEYLLKLNGAVTFTHGDDLVCPEALDVVAYSGMIAWVKKEAGDVWRLIWYTNRMRVTGGGASRVIFNGAALTGNVVITLPNGPVTVPSGVLITAADVAGAVAAISQDTVGSPVFAVTSASVAFGGTVAGSALQPSNANNNVPGSALTGTWRCHGKADGGTAGSSSRTTLFVKILP